MSDYLKRFIKHSLTTKHNAIAQSAGYAHHIEMFTVRPPKRAERDCVCLVHSLACFSQNRVSTNFS